MKVLKVDHIGIAVKNLEESLNFYTEVLGLKNEGIEVVEEQQVKVAFLPCGDSELELLESTTLTDLSLNSSKKTEKVFNTLL